FGDISSFSTFVHQVANVVVDLFHVDQRRGPACGTVDPRFGVHLYLAEGHQIDRRRVGILRRSVLNRARILGRWEWRRQGTLLLLLLLLFGWWLWKWPVED